MHPNSSTKQRDNLTLAPSPQFQSIQESTDAFLALFPHRYDYLWADHPQPTERPDWKTESRHPLGDRLIQQGSYLYGVRFGPTTRYILIDIDKGSIYHPIRDRLAWKRLVATLEPLGLVQPVACTSSYREGLHLYFPFSSAQKTWAIALVVATLLENAGFKLSPGQLEIFPNRKAYNPDGEPSLYNGHRLPMQAGSYLLNEDLQMIWGDQDTFVRQWQFAQCRNNLKESIIARTIKAARRRQYRITRKADKFLNDLNAEIEQGWTGPGQTNRLLGRITLRSYIFGHVLYANGLLKGKTLIQNIMAIAQALPGYEEWCRHRHELEKRVTDWVKAIEQSHYFPYGTQKSQTPPENESALNQQPDWNEQQKMGARERIRQAVTGLLEQTSLPIGITARFNALVCYGISGSTLYKHRDLWHPRHFQQEINSELHKGAPEDCPEGASSGDNPLNLLVQNECNSLLDRAFNDPRLEELLGYGCNSLEEQRFIAPEGKPMTPEEGIAHIREVLEQIRKQRQEEKQQKLRRKFFPFNKNNFQGQLPPLLE